MSSTVNYKAKTSDTVENLAAAASVKISEILELNRELKANSKLTPNKVYRLPRSAAPPGASAVNDLAVEFNARKAEAERKE